MISIAGGVSTAAQAQDVGGTLEEITVTAQRREQSLQDVPISLTAYSAESLQRNMVEGISDYFVKTPNVYITEGATRSGNVSESELGLAIRGISNIGGNSSSFGVYIDDFNVTRATLNPHLVDIERIEILRGPQGTYFGRNASAGAISIYTKKPTDHLEAEVTGQYGRFNTWEVQGMVNVPVTEKFYLRAAGKLAESDGNLRNVNAVGGGNSYQHKNIRLAGRFLPSDNFTVDLTATYTDEKQDDLGLVHTGVLSDFIKSICAPPVFCPADTQQGFYPNNRKYYNHDNPLRVTDSYWMFTGKFEYATDDISITSITGYITTDFSRSGELDMSSFDFLNEDFQYVKKTSFSQELRIQSANSGPFHWTVGGIYAVDTKHGTESINAGRDASGLGLWPGFIIELSNEDQSITSMAGFGEVSWDATDALTVTVGGRYSHDKLEQGEDKIEFEEFVPYTHGRKSFSDFSPRLAVTYKATDAVNLYGTISKGWKSGGFQLDPVRGRRDFGSETLWNYEAGIKSTWLNNRLHFNLSAFYIDWKNVQVRSSVFTVENGVIYSSPGISNAASASSKGLELEMVALPVRDLELTFNAGYNKAKFKTFAAAVTNNGTLDLSGWTLPKAPKWTLSATAQYNVALTDKWEGFIRGEWSYIGQTYSNVNALGAAKMGHLFPFEVPAYNKANFRVGADNGKYRVVAYIENAFNENYYTSSYDFGFVDGAAVVPGFRTFGIRATAKFQ
nr:TonB-dependent receptor [Govania unica]